MRWGDFRKSDNIEDRTDGSNPQAGHTGGGGRFPGGGMKLSGGALFVVVVVSLLFGVNPMDMLGGGDSDPVPAPQQVPPGYGPQQVPPGYGPQQPPPASGRQQLPPGYGAQPTPPNYSPPPAPRPPGAQTPRKPDPAKEFVARVLGDTEDVWGAVFKAAGSRYDPPRLVLFSGVVPSACGRASASAGPFYCPADRKVYLDTAFFNELARRFGAPGDFAQAYVIAHEVGHHVQNVTGVMRQFDQQASRGDARARNALSVRLELQADCYAGVWGHFAQRRKLLEPGDIEEGMRATEAVGDDMLQKKARGHVVPDAFTHGTAAQRQRWFKVGLESGDMRNCNTFAARQL